MSSARSRSDTDALSTDALSTALDAATTALARAVLAVGSRNPVVLIDGRSGAGKTSLAGRLAAQWPLPGRVQSLALDAVYPGWDGLAAGADYVRERVLEPHARGEIGIWRRWDWEAGRRAESHEVDPSLALIVEGAGALTAATAPLADMRVWVDAPASARRGRALERDGETYEPHWDGWARQEDEHEARDAPRERASLVFVLP